MYSGKNKYQSKKLKEKNLHSIISTDALSFETGSSLIGEVLDPELAAINLGWQPLLPFFSKKYF